MTESEQLRIDFWTELAAYLKSAGADFRFNPSIRQWLRVRSPHRGFRCCFAMSRRERYIEVEIGANTREKVYVLRRICHDQKGRLERELAAKIKCDDNEKRGSFWIHVECECDPGKKDDWPRQHQWMNDAMKRLLEAVGGK